MRISDFLAKADPSRRADTAWGALDWIIPSSTMPSASMTFGIVTIAAGARNPLHSHPNCEEILHVLQGRCEHKLGEAVFEMGPGDTIRIPQGVPHWARSLGPEPLVAVIAFSSGDRLTDNHEDAGSA